LAQKGVVAREKSGRAYLYRANLTAEQARAHAVERIVNGFFEGSAQALAAQLSGAPMAVKSTAPVRVVLPAAVPRAERSAGAQEKVVMVSASAAREAAAATPAEESLDAALL
jgi:hypothetical protein